MRDAQSPMPPSGARVTASAAEIATIQSWIDAGYPKGDCIADAGTSPPDAGSSDAGTTPSGLPCAVADVLSAHCTSCHSSPPAASVPMALTSYADLTALSAIYPSSSVAQRCVIRMQDAQSPMPPGATPTSTPGDISTLQSWIAGGYQAGTCGSDGGTNPFDTPPVCSSGAYWNGGEGSSLMHPGRACNACHLQNGEGEAPIFAIAGTVFPTAHEPNDCLSTSVGTASVTIQDAVGNVVTLHPNSNGNFTYAEAGFAYPYTAKVTYQGMDRAMVASQTNGDCNGCHTQSGSQGAPGRILLP